MNFLPAEVRKKSRLGKSEPGSFLSEGISTFLHIGITCSGHLSTEAGIGFSESGSK